MAPTPDASAIQLLPESQSDFPLAVSVDSWPAVLGLALLALVVGIAAFVEGRRAR